MSDHHVRWSSFNGEHHYVDHIYYMIHARPFGLSVPRPYLQMLGSSSLTRVFCMCKTGLHPLYKNVELITPDHHVVSRHDELWQWCILKKKHRHDHHRHRRDTLIFIVASLSSRQLLLLRLSLPLSDKVKQLQGDCIAYNKATTIWLLPVADNFNRT